ncbi:hypothetical protein Vafri_15098, partial [Volvox africanus]
DSAAAAVASSPGAAAIHGSSVATVKVPYAADSTPRSVWDFLLRTHGSVAAENGDGGAAPPVVEQSEPAPYCPSETPVAVWQAHLRVAGEAHDMPVMSSYNKAESPVLVWNSLLGVQATSTPSTAATAAPIPAVTADEAAATVVLVGGSSALLDNTCALLPRPLHKPKAAVASPTVAITAITSAPEMATPPPAPTGASPTSTMEAASLSSSSAAVAAAAQVGAAPASFGQEHQQRRRRPRGQAGPVSGRWAVSDRRGAGKMSGGHGKSRRSSAAFAAGNSTSAGAVSASKAKAKAVAAKAAATMTVSLSAAAALGGVIGAGTGHMPMDMTAALHAHGAVAQFWEDLNSLTLSSASLSSIDLP